MNNTVNNNITHQTYSPQDQTEINNMNPPVSADVHSNSIKASEMECDVASQSGSGVLMMMENYPAEISDDEFSPRSRVEHNPIDESEGGEMRATSAVSTGSSSASSSQSKNRNRSESASRSDTTDNTTGMKDWGWFIWQL